MYLDEVSVKRSFTFVPRVRIANDALTFIDNFKKISCTVKRLCEEVTQPIHFSNYKSPV
jgi:hypothetical protein